MNRFEEVADLNRELLRMADFTAPLWNGGSRFWLEHRGPALARALADSPGLKLWLQSPPLGSDINYTLKVCSLFADHVIVGHSGPLPPLHYSLCFPWRGDDRTEIPDKRLITKPTRFPIWADAVRRHLPPVARECLFGDARLAMELGIVSYFPASIVYAPIGDNPWPSPAEILSRNGAWPPMNRAYAFAADAPAEGKAKLFETVWSDKSNELTMREVAEIERKKVDEGFFANELGIPVFNEQSINRTVWEWSDDSINWELMFSSLIASGGVEVPDGKSVQLSRLPEATLELRLPYLQNADWEIIYKLREKESDALESLRAAVLKACSSVSAVHGSKRFQNAVTEIQEKIIDKGVEDVRKSFRSKTLRKSLKLVGLGFATVTLEIACFLGLPPLTAFVAGGAAIKGAIDVALDIRRDEQEWKKRAKSEMPMYFLWRLKRGK